MLKISLVIPIYNMQEYLTDCLDSCLNQDLDASEYEIICVNDGSIDDSIKILKEYSSKYKNIKVINKNNEGVSKARNIGILNAKGQFIWFIDSDDYVHSNCLRIIVNIAIQNKLEAIFINYKKIEQEHKYNKSLNNVNITNKVQVIKDKEQIYQLYSSDSHGNQGNYIWGCILKRSFLVDNQLYFNEKMFAQEDTLLFFYLREKLNSACKFESQLYYYRQRNKSIMHDRTLEAKIKYYYSLKEMTRVYEREIRNAFYSKRTYRMLKNKSIHAKEGATFSLILIDNLSFVKKELLDLKQLKYYPYKLRWELLRINGNLKSVLIGLTKLLIPFEPYFWLYWLLNHKIIKK